MSNCKVVMTAIGDYNPAYQYIARVRPTGSGQIPEDGSPYYKAVTSNVVSFEGLPDNRWEIGIQVVIDGVVGDIYWQEAEDPAVPAIPEVVVSSITATTAIVTWAAIPGAAQYEYQVNDGPWTRTIALTFTISGLVAGMVNRFKVRVLMGYAVGPVKMVYFQTYFNSGNPYAQVFTLAKKCFGNNLQGYLQRYVIGNGLKTNGSVYALYYNKTNTLETIATTTKLNTDTLGTLIMRLSKNLGIVPGSLIIRDTFASFDIIDGNSKIDENFQPILCSDAVSTGNYSAEYIA